MLFQAGAACWRPAARLCGVSLRATRSAWARNCYKAAPLCARATSQIHHERARGPCDSICTNALGPRRLATWPSSDLDNKFACSASRPKSITRQFVRPSALRATFSTWRRRKWRRAPLGPGVVARPRAAAARPNRVAYNSISRITRAPAARAPGGASGAPPLAPQMSYDSSSCLRARHWPPARRCAPRRTARAAPRAARRL